MVSWLHVWEPVSVNRSSRPILLDSEFSVFLREGIGLYQGKLKIKSRQEGRVYLTNKRVIYIDKHDISLSVGLDLNQVSTASLVEGFFRSSPKVKLFLKNIDRSHTSSHTRETNYGKIYTNWACYICSYNNEISLDYQISKGAPICVSCGIKSPIDIIESVLKKKREQVELEGPTKSSSSGTETHTEDESESSKGSAAEKGHCKRCTFINHPSLRFCEMCGAELDTSDISARSGAGILNAMDDKLVKESDLEGLEEVYTDDKPYIKLSFRKDGALQFYNNLIEQLDKLKWEKLQQKGMINENAVKVQRPSVKPPEILGVGIHALEKISEVQRKQNEMVLASSLEDLEQMMYRAQDLISLSNIFGRLIEARQIVEGIVPPLKIKKSSKLYHQELSRHISEYLANLQLTKSSSMVTVQEAFASYNRYLVSTQGFGTELVAAEDFGKAVELFDELKLPFRLKHYKKSDISVICYRNSFDNSQLIRDMLEEQERTFKYNLLKAKLLAQYQLSEDSNYWHERFAYFKGSTIPEICNALGWSYAITVEEIDTCVEAGLVVVDKHVLGAFYFVNRFAAGDIAAFPTPADLESDPSLVELVQLDIAREQLQLLNLSLSARFSSPVGTE